MGVAIVEFNQSVTLFGDRRLAPALDASALIPVSAATLDLSARSSSLVFIDSTVSDYQSLLAATAVGTEVHVLDPLQDAISQITQTLLGRTGIASVQILSHGFEDNIQIGSTRLNTNTLGLYASDLQAWATALTPDADILFYGCKVAATATGQGLVQQIAQMTGADIAASTNLTGSAQAGGDWTLEFQTGAIEAFLAFRADALAAYNGVLLAPTLTDTVVSLLSVVEDTGAPVGAVGTPIGQLVRLTGPGANVTDTDVGALTGIAITGSNTANGQWFYSTNGGTLWTTLGVVSPPEARLLAADSNTRLYFQPNPNYSGTVTDGLTFRAWDQTAGSNGGTADTTTAGGASAFSLALDGAAITVVDINDPPTIAAIAPQTLNEDSVTLPLTLSIGDLETPATALVLSATATDSILFPTGSITLGGSGNARTVTLAPAANEFGTAIITLTVSDGTLTTSTTFDVVVNPVNDVPTITPAIANQTIPEDTPLPLTFTIGDLETAPNALRVRAVSDNATLYPATNLTLGGTGAIRTLTLTPAANAFGTANITLSVSDGTDTTRQTFQVGVTSVNDAPTVSPIANQLIDEDTPLGPISFTVSDVETPATALTLSAASSNTALIPDSSIVLSGTGSDRAIALTPAANAFGTATITLSVSDGTSTTLRSFTVAVAAVNDAPTLSPIIPNQVVNEDTALPIVFTLGDVETPVNSLSLFAASDNPALYSGAGLSLSGTGATRTLLLTPTANAFGTANITLSVNDGTTSTLRSFNVQVNAVNDPPTLTAIPNQTLLEDGSTGPLLITLSDVDTPATALTLTAVSSNTALVPSSSISLGGADSLRTLTVKPAANQSGTATLTLTVNDGALSAVRSFDVVVQAVNDAPILDTSGTPILTAIAEDTLAPTGDLVSNLLVRPTGGSIVTDVDTNALKGIAITQVDTTHGSWEFSLSTGSAWTPLSTVTPATARLLAADADTRLRFVPQANYNGPATFTFQAWDQTSGTNGAIASTTPNGGSTAFSTALETATITVLPVNDLPTVSVVSLTLNEDTRLTFTDTDFTRSYSDIDNNPLAALQILTLPANGRLSLGNTAVTPNQTLTAAAISTLTFTPAPNYFGSDSFTWSASDGTAFATTPATVSLTVNSVNDAPRFTPGTTSQVVTAGDPTQTLANWATGFSPGPFNEASQTLVQYVVSTSRPDLFLTLPTVNAAGTLTYTPAMPATVTTPGIATVIIQARDSGGTLNGGNDLSAPTTLTIAVNPQPIVSISNPATNPLIRKEGRTGPTPYTFTVGLSVASTQTVTVGYGTVDVTASATAGDYAALSDTLTFLPGELTKTVVVNVAGDRRPEANESFLLTLGNVTNSAIAPGAGTATGIILNDDFEDAPDFDGDGFKDIFWRNPSTGANYLWFTNDRSGVVVDRAVELPTAPDLDWNVEQINDFNGDGFSDLLWRNRRTGENYIWLLNGSGVIGANALPTVSDLAWQIVDVNDFNNDGQADILWRRKDSPLNVVWYMNGTQRIADPVLTGQPILDYTNVVFGGASDFNGDGQVDIVVYNTVTNATSIWLMNGIRVDRVVDLAPLAGVGWKVERLDDFNGDGRAEILWRNRITGDNLLWDVSNAITGPVGGSVTTSILPDVRDLNWRIAGTGDYTRDGRTDILWRNYSSNQNLIWQMNGVTRAVDIDIASAPNAIWEIQG